MSHMDNSYIVDAFLSGAIWVLVTYMYFDIVDRVTEIGEIMPNHLLALAIGELFKRSVYIAAPFVFIWMFLMWRFYALMILSHTFGAGGAGLLIILGVGGAGMIWMISLLSCVKRSRYVDAAEVGRRARLAKQGLSTPTPAYAGQG